MKLFSRPSCSRLSLFHTALLILLFFALIFSFNGCGRKKEEVVKKEVIRPVKIIAVDVTGGQDVTRDFPGKVRASQRVDLARRECRADGPHCPWPRQQWDGRHRGREISKCAGVLSAWSDFAQEPGAG